MLNNFGHIVGGAKYLIEINAEELIESAISSTSLDDFHDLEWLNSFKKRIDVLNHSNLHLRGKIFHKCNLLTMLRNRLFVTRMIKEKPEIRDEKIDRPIFVTGLPRTGTTFLFELLSQHPNFRSPIALEALCPVIPPISSVSRDVSRKTIVTTLQSPHQENETLKSIHYVNYNRPVECYSIMDSVLNDNYPAVSKNDSYKTWRSQINPENNYKWHKTILQLLQFKKTKKTWILKCPFHINNLDTLFELYPDAKIIHTHRNPVESINSWINAITLENQIHSYDINDESLRRRSLIPLEGGLRGVIDQRISNIFPQNSIYDLYFNDLVRNPIMAMASACEQLHIDTSACFTKRMHAYIRSNPRNKHGKYSYSDSDLSLDANEIRDQFSFYTEFYNIAT